MPRKEYQRYAAIGIGGAAGATARWALILWLHSGSRFPWQVLLVNVVGCAILGTVLAEEWEHPKARLLLHDLAGIGFCGGLTTFSTFAVNIAELIDGHDQILAVAYMAVSVVCGLVAVLLAAVATRRIRVLTLPLEQQP